MTAPATDLYPSRTRARLETRARVREAALAEFQRVGVEGAQIEDIVRAAGVARGTFYLHFPTKDHVLIDLVAECAERVAAALTDVDPLKPALVLRRVVDGIADEVAGPYTALVPDALAVIARNGEEVGERAPALAERLTGILATGQREGSIRAGVPATDLAAVFLSSVAGLLVTKREASPRGLRTALRRAATLLEPVLLAPDGETALPSA